MTWALRARRLVRSRRIALPLALRAGALRSGPCEGAARLVHRAGQPLAAIAASRYAPRPCACGSLVATSRYALGTEGVGAARPGAYMCCSPDNLRALPLGGRDVEGVERFALLETLGARRVSRSC